MLLLKGRRAWLFVVFKLVVVVLVLGLLPAEARLGLERRRRRR
jgi:hypothetical protein